MKTTAIKNPWYWHNDGHTDQRNREESPQINPYIYGQLIFKKRQSNSVGESMGFSRTVLGQWDIQMQKHEFRPLCNSQKLTQSR